MHTIGFVAFGFGFSAIMHCIYMAFQLLRLNTRKSNTLLGLILLVLSIRIGKSLLAWFWPESVFLFSIVGLTFMATLGPLLRLYALTLNDLPWNSRVKEVLHFFPAPIIGAMAALSLSNNDLFFCYLAVNLQLLLYLGWSLWITLAHRSFDGNEIAYHWLTRFFCGLSLISITFSFHLFVDDRWMYLGSTLLAAVVLYLLSWISKRYSRIFLTPSRKSEFSLHLHQLAKKVETEFLQEEIYRDSSLTLARLASQLKCPHYEISQAVNAYFKKTFPELLLYHRIKNAESLLTDPQNGHLTIEAIAYECGFNSLSAFYAGFKKLNNVSPSQFRDRAKLTSLDLKRIS